MSVHVRIRLELADGTFTWWAKVPELPGLSIMSESLNELEAMAESAIREILRDRHEDADQPIVWELVSEPPPAREAAVRFEGTERTAGEQRVASLVRVA